MNTNQVRCSKPPNNRRYSFEVCIYWESDICWQVDILLANQECCSKSVASKKRTQVQKPQGADCRWFFLQPSPLAPLPHRFLFRPRISFQCQLRTLAMFVGNYFNPILQYPLLPPPCSYTPVGHRCFTSWNEQAIRGYPPKITFFNTCMPSV